MSHHSDKRLSDMTPPDERLVLFEREIARQEDLIYGVALLFECLSVLHCEHSGIVETYRKQFRNVIQNGRSAIQSATAILAEAKSSPAAIRSLEAFRFSPCNDHPDPEGLTRRAEILVAAFNELFPGRPRSQEFTRDETMKLLEHAASVFES